MVAQAIHDTDDEPARENTPSELDDLTHAEMCMLYRESADAIRFAKAHQWKSLGATLLVFAGMLTLGRLVPGNPTLPTLLIHVSFLNTPAVLSHPRLYPKS